MKISDLHPDKKNARRRNARASRTIEHSLKELGAGRSIVIDKHGQIIAGNGVIENAGKAGITEVEVVQSDGSKIIAVQRMDLDLDSPKARQLAVADNRTAELAEWDPNILAGFSTELNLEPYFTTKELTALKVLPVDDSAATDQSGALGSTYSVLVTLADEASQLALLERLMGEGFECRSLIA
jgi:hypothetical protein